MSIFGVGVTNHDSMISSSRETRTASGAGAYGGVGNVYAPYQITRSGTSVSPGGISRWKFVDTHNESPAARALHAGEQSLVSMIGAAKSGVGAANSGAQAMKSDASAMRNQAMLVNSQADSIKPTIDELSALIPQLTPYADQLAGYGEDLAALAGLLTNNSNDAFGQASALSKMDPGATGIAKEFMDLYALLSPDRYVSQAASDAQSSFNNMVQQLERQNARRGLSAGSGASMALKDQMGRALAAALAATKTRARQTGIDEQSKMLSSMTNAAQAFYNMGTEGASQATSTLGAAANAQNAAAGIVAQQGSMLKDVGALQAQVADLYATGANIFGSAAGIEGSATKLTADSTNALIAAQQAAANYYLQAASVQGVY